jgi:hypothetical protein
MNLFKKALISIVAISTFQVANAKEDNISFSTSPIPLSKVISTESMGISLNYDDLTLIGKNKYKGNIKFIDGGKWNHLKGTDNIYIATNKNNEVGIITVHYSFKNIETTSRYRKSLAKRYPLFKKTILNSNLITISGNNKPEIKYDTARNYMDSILLEANKELNSNRLRYQKKQLDIEISKDGLSSIETYLDLKIAPQWDKSIDIKYISVLNNIIKEITEDKSKLSEELLDSTEYMKNLISSNKLYIF